MIAYRRRALDRARLAAYGWPEGLSDDETLGRLLKLNGERAAGGTASDRVDRVEGSSVNEPV